MPVRVCGDRPMPIRVCGVRLMPESVCGGRLLSLRVCAGRFFCLRWSLVASVIFVCGGRLLPMRVLRWLLVVANAVFAVVACCCQCVLCGGHLMPFVLFAVGV